MFAGQNKKAERAEIDKKFARVMDAKGFLPGDTRRAKWLDFSYAKKSKKIENWEKTHAAKGLPGLDSNVFEYVEKFRERTMDVDGLDDLCEKLATADPKWIRDFISCNGVSWLFELLSSGVHIAGSIRKQKEDVERLELAIACVVEMINNGGSGLKELLAIPDSFRVIIRSLCFIANDKKSLVFELMAAVLLISEDSWSVVTEAVHHFKDSYPADFKKLLVELAEGEDMDYKVAFLTFINTMIVQGQSIVDRVRVREDFIAENITDILGALKSSHADDQDLQEQCIVFDEELENDGTELKQQQAHAVKQAASGESNDSKPVEIITSLWNKMKGTELEPMLLSILHAMLHLGLSLDCGGEGGGDSTLAKQVWGIIEKLVKQFDVIGKASGITYEHVLAAFMKETSKTAKISFEQSGGVSTAGPPPVPIPVPPTPEEPSAPPPPPPGAPPPPPPGAPPPPPGAPPGPPPAPGMPGAKSEPSFMDPDRPAMLPWRWQIIPPMQVQGTLFADLNAMKLVDEGLIDGTELENIFALKPKILATDSKEEESKAAAIKSKLAGKASAKSNPTLLSPQRCNIISIVTHRLPYSVEEMTKAINEIDKKFVTIKSMSELRNLFPAKEYEDEMKKMVEFKGEPSELTEAEALMYGFFKKVTRVREKISALLFVEEANEKLKECTANAHVVKSALEELHNEKLRSVLEIALAVGNYLNNPRAECKGFRLSSLLKLNDVVSKTRPKFTLLHHIAEIVERKFPELLLFPDELVHLQEAKVAIESLQVELSFVRKDFELLKHELELCKNEGNKTWVSYLEAAEGKIATSIKHLEKLDEQFKQDILYFGERSADDMSSFFSDWDKFVQSFQTAVKYNITLRRKNEAMQKKEAALEKKKVLLEKKEQAKKKKEEAAKKKLLLAKKKKEVDATNRKRAKTDGKTEGGVKEEKGSAKRTNSFYERSENKGSRINRHTSMLLNDSVAYANVKGEKKGMDVDTMVDDLLQSTPIPDRGARRDGGTVKQLVYSLRTSTRFSKIRDSRAEGAPAAGPVSLETEQRLVKQVSTRLPKFTKEDLAKMNAGHN